MFNLTVLINQDSYQALTRLGIPCAIVVGIDIPPLVHTDAKDYLITSVRRIQKTNDQYGFFNGVTFNPETNVIVFFFEGSKLQHDISDASKLEDLIHVLKFYTNLQAVQHAQRIVTTELPPGQVARWISRKAHLILFPYL
jgi:hypothetical protein